MRFLDFSLGLAMSANTGSRAPDHHVTHVASAHQKNKTNKVSAKCAPVLNNTTCNMEKHSRLPFQLNNMDTKPATDLSVVPLLVGIWPHLLAPLTFLVLFTLPPFRLRSAIYLAAFTFFFLRCFVPLSIPPEWSQLTLSFALAWMYYLGWLAKMLFYQPEHHFWRVGRPAHEAEYYTGLLNRQKLGWACQLLASPRGVGWNFQVRGLRPRSRLYGRWWFVAMQIARATALAPVSVGMSAVLARDYHALGGWWKALVLGPVEALKIWADQEALYSVFCALFVAAGFSREEVCVCLSVRGKHGAAWRPVRRLIGVIQDCLPLFGNNITELDSLQEFWGQFWHQNFRVVCTSCPSSQR